MSFLAEILAIILVWLSSVALGQFGIVLDTCPMAKSASERTVSCSPRGTVRPPAAMTTGGMTSSNSADDA